MAEAWSLMVGTVALEAVTILAPGWKRQTIRTGFHLTEYEPIILESEMDKEHRDALAILRVCVCLEGESRDKRIIWVKWV